MSGEGGCKRQGRSPSHNTAGDLRGLARVDSVRSITSFARRATFSCDGGGGARSLLLLLLLFLLLVSELCSELHNLTLSLCLEDPMRHRQFITFSRLDLRHCPGEADDDCKRLGVS